MLCIEVQLTLPNLPVARRSPSSFTKGANCRIWLPFAISFSAFRDLISSLNCSSSSFLKMIAFAFSLSSMLTTSVPGLCLLNARCRYATVFTSRPKLLNRSH